MTYKYGIYMPLDVLLTPLCVWPCPGVGSAEGLAYDQHTQYLYWSSYSESSIERLKVDGSSEKERVVKLRSEDHPRAIVINSCGSSMG